MTSVSIYWIREAGLTLVCLLAVLMTGCTGGPSVSDRDVEALEVERTAEMMERDGTVLVDVRSPEAYAAGHLPGAVNIPFKDLRRSHQSLKEAGRIIVYGQNWSDPLSIAGAKRLIALGYDDVFEFKGGVELWVDNDRRLAGSDAEGRARPESDD